MNLMMSTLACALLATAPFQAFAGHHHNKEKSGQSIGDYVKDIPGIGLISDSIAFDGITISNFTFEGNDHKWIFVNPGQDFVAHMNYTIDSAALKSLHLHHFVIGLHEDGPQCCLLHSLGLKDAAGSTSVKLKAPMKRGAYQVRLNHSEGLTDDDAFKAWWRGDGPSSKTIVGIVIVQ